MSHVRGRERILQSRPFKIMVPTLMILLGKEAIAIDGDHR